MSTSRAVKRCQRLAGGLAVSVGLLIGGAAPGLAAPSPTNERLVFVASYPQASDDLVGRVVASGKVNGVGTFTAGPGDDFEVRVTLPQGGLSVALTTPSKVEMADPRTCVARVAETNTGAITGGTGAFTGATGSFDDTVHGVLLFGRRTDGSCDFAAAPVSGVVVVNAIAALA